MKLATGTMPVVSAQACGPPSSSMRVGGLRGGAVVVPQQGVADRRAGLVDEHHAVLLAADGDRLDAVEEAGGGLAPRPATRPARRPR